jgi:2'-5' RNA ligase
MPRLFTGLELPSDLAMDLSMLRGGLSGARWIDAENYHLTLRFIGDIDDSTARDIHSILEKIRHPPFTVTIEGLSSFGGAKPRALVARAKAATPLLELQAQQERLMRRIGIAP